MSQRFIKGNVVIWIHPLGLLYKAQVSATGRNSDFGDYAIIFFNNVFSVCVSQDSIRKDYIGSTS